MCSQDARGRGTQGGRAWRHEGPPMAQCMEPLHPILPSPPMTPTATPAHRPRPRHHLEEQAKHVWGEKSEEQRAPRRWPTMDSSRQNEARCFCVCTLTRGARSEKRGFSYFQAPGTCTEHLGAAVGWVSIVCDREAIRGSYGIFSFHGSGEEIISLPVSQVRGATPAAPSHMEQVDSAHTSL